MNSKDIKQPQTEQALCAIRANYPLINPQGKHTSNIDISKLSIVQLQSIYASGYCILTKRIAIAKLE